MILKPEKAEYWHISEEAELQDSLLCSILCTGGLSHNLSENVNNVKNVGIIFENFPYFYTNYEGEINDDIYHVPLYNRRIRRINSDLKQKIADFCETNIIPNTPNLQEACKIILNAILCGNPSYYHQYVLELADYCFSENYIRFAKILYKLAVNIQPLFAGGWKKYAEFLNEVGLFYETERILKIGKMFCANCDLKAESLIILSPQKRLKDKEKNVSSQWQIYAKLGMEASKNEIISDSRRYFSYAIRCAPDSVKWKLFLLNARIETWHSNYYASFKLLHKSAEVVPIRKEPQLLIDFAKNLEFEYRFSENGNCSLLEKARKILDKTVETYGQDWKIHLERIMFEIRNNNLLNAENSAKNAIKIHVEKGKLWALLLQIQHAKQISGEIAYETFVDAIRRLPRSGEIWCEGARLFMSPKFIKFDLQKSRKCLDFAIHFTPRCGDCFIELLRLSLIEDAIGVSEDFHAVEKIIQKCKEVSPTYGTLWNFFKWEITDTEENVMRHAKNILENEVKNYKIQVEAKIMKENTRAKIVQKISLNLFDGYEWTGCRRVTEIYRVIGSGSKEEIYRLIYGGARIIQL